MRFRWPWRRAESRPSATMISISDPALASLLNAFPANYSGVEVNESSVLGLSAVYRAVALISGTLGQLPLRTLRDIGGGQRQRVNSFLDNPGGTDGPTPFEWTQTNLLYLLLHGETFLRHVFGGAGQILALQPVHPLCVEVRWAAKWPDGMPVTGGKIFKMHMLDGSIEEHDASTMTQIMSMSIDGLRGLSPITIARNSIGTGIAGDRAAAKMFSDGALFSGLVSADGEDLDPDEAKVIRETLERKTLGWENAGSIRFINRKLKFTPWTMTAADAQFLQSRQFSIEEVARWFGVPPHLLMQTEKQTSWGTGVEEQNNGLGRYVLAPWATMIEQRLSRLLPNPRFVEFDFSGLERPTPEDEIALLISEIDGGLITINEARAVRNLPPIEGGNVLRLHGQPILEPAPAPVHSVDEPEEVPA